jgi:hypothetical protein
MAGGGGQARIMTARSARMSGDLILRPGADLSAPASLLVVGAGLFNLRASR